MVLPWSYPGLTLVLHLEHPLQDQVICLHLRFSFTNKQHTVQLVMCYFTKAKPVFKPVAVKCVRSVLTCGHLDKHTTQTPDTGILLYRESAYRYVKAL